MAKVTRHHGRECVAASTDSSWETGGRLPCGCNCAGCLLLGEPSNGGSDVLHPPRSRQSTPAFEPSKRERQRRHAVPEPSRHESLAPTQRPVSYLRRRRGDWPPRGVLPALPRSGVSPGTSVVGVDGVRRGGHEHGGTIRSLEIGRGVRSHKGPNRSRHGGHAIAQFTGDRVMLTPDPSDSSAPSPRLALSLVRLGWEGAPRSDGDRDGDGDCDERPRWRPRSRMRQRHVEPRATQNWIPRRYRIGRFGGRRDSDCPRQCSVRRSSGLIAVGRPSLDRADGCGRPQREVV